jgi:hypothetical protein
MNFFTLPCTFVSLYLFLKLINKIIHFFLKIHLKVYQKYIDLFLYFQNTFSTENDANFIITAFCFPVLFSTYRYCLENSTIMFKPFFGFLILNRILEPLLLVFIPCYILFLYFSKKSYLFYFHFWSSISFIIPFFRFLFFFYRVMVYFGQNIFFGCVFLLLLFLLYLYCLFIDSPLIHLKPLIVFPLLAFRVFLSSINQKHWLFIVHPEFLFIKSQLEEPNNHYGCIPRFF